MSDTDLVGINNRSIDYPVQAQFDIQAISAEVQRLRAVLDVFVSDKETIREVDRYNWPMGKAETDYAHFWDEQIAKARALVPPEAQPPEVTR